MQPTSPPAKPHTLIIAPHRHAHTPAHTRTHSLQCMLASSHKAIQACPSLPRSSPEIKSLPTSTHLPSAAELKFQGMLKDFNALMFSSQKPTRWEEGESAREGTQEVAETASLSSPLPGCQHRLPSPCVPVLTVAGSWNRRQHQPSPLIRPPSQMHLAGFWQS